MSLSDFIMSPRLHPGSALENVGRSAFLLALLLLPGSFIALPLLWWLDRRAARSASSQAGDRRGAPES
jgi:hypothetical protein